MPKVKGTDIVGLKAMLKSEGKDLEKKILSKLSEEDQKIYQSIIATSWTDVDTMARLIEAVGETMFPGISDACTKLGQKLSEKSYSGIYSVFLLIPKASYVFKRAANVWKSYYDKGVANVENITDTSMDLVVRGFPELPKALRNMTTGHISVLLTKTGQTDASIKLNDSNPDAWTWHATWT